MRTETYLEWLEEFLKILVVAMFMFLPTYLLYSPIHEGFHVLGCIGTGLEIQSIDWHGSVACQGLGQRVLKSTVVYSMPYLFGLLAVSGFHWKEKTLKDTRFYPYLTGIASIIYFDMLLNGFIMMFIAYATGYYKLGGTDLVKLANMDMKLAGVLYLVFMFTLTLWWFRGKDSMLRLYDKIEFCVESTERGLKNVIKDVFQRY